MIENRETRIYNTDELYMGDIIKVEDFIYVHMERNNDRPFVDGRLIRDKKHNLFIKDGEKFIHLTSGVEYPVMSYPCPLGDIGIQDFALKPLKERLAGGFKEYGVESLDLTFEDCKKLQKIYSELFTEHEISLTNRFGDFLSYYETERE